MSSAIPPALHWPLQFCLFSTTTTYILSIFTANVSQVDRIWTFLPTIYTAYFALLPLWSNTPLPYLPLLPYTPTEVKLDATGDYSPRALLMFGLIFTWMCRLSYNTYRRGLFSLADEDYRWAVLRKQLHPWLFQLTNLTFIAGIQNILLLLLGLPTYIASAVQPHTPLSLSDILLSLFALLVLAIEFTADNQQYSFQSYKHSGVLDSSIKKALDEAEANRVRQGSGHGIPLKYDAKKQWPGARLAWTLEDAKRGFVTKGLWGYSRHPNFACEQTFWWIITLIPLLSPTPPNLPSPFTLLPSLFKTLTITFPPSPQALISILAPLAPVLPALSLSLLFYSSTLYTEAISLSKYPDAYKAYQERVGMFGFFRTWEKGLILGWQGQGKREEVEALVWGKGKSE